MFDFHNDLPFIFQNNQPHATKYKGSLYFSALTNLYEEQNNRRRLMQQYGLVVPTLQDVTLKVPISIELYNREMTAEQFNG